MSRWSVPQWHAAREIGEKEIRRLRKLRQWLYGTPQQEAIEFRTAPSLVARSEVELFDISMPRFAFRAYLTPKSFVNARRIETFCELTTSWGQPPAGYQGAVRPEIVKRRPCERIRGASSCIADSLLEPPEKLRSDGYHVLTTELGRAYGERTEIKGTPFVNHIRLGGGMCAQAVCFMATALLQHAVRGIYGVAEITALASPQKERHLDLGGMTPEKICRFFDHPRVGLSSLPQRVFIRDDEVGADSRAVRHSAEVLRAYLLSDIPVVLLVDFGRMCGVSYELVEPETAGDESSGKAREATRELVPKLVDRCVFERNDLLDLDVVKTCREKTKARLDEKAESQREHDERRGLADQELTEGVSRKERPHAVLVVGCRKTHGEAADDQEPCWEFLVNDPTTYPFLKASALELAQVRPYGELKKGRLGAIQFISVAPQEVRLPLLNAGLRGSRRSGLLDIADTLQMPGFGLDFPEFQDHGGRMGEFRLIDLRWCRRFRSKEEEEEQRQDRERFDTRLDHISSEGRQCLSDLASGGGIPPKWCWVQYGSPAKNEVPGASIWVWDATVPPPPEEVMGPASTAAMPRPIRDKYLLAVLVKEAEGWRVDYPVAPPDDDEAARRAGRWRVPHPAYDSLRPALISSFHTDKSEVVCQGYPDNVAVDLYVFMQPEVRDWLKGNPQFASDCPDKTNAVAVMAALADNQEAIANWAAKASEHFPRERATPIVALASFVPEVTAIQPVSYRRALGALRFLIRFAHALRRDHQQPLRAVELVAGSRIGGIWPAGEEGRYAASRSDEAAARRRVLSLLGQVLTEYADQQPQERVFTSIELEPGPLYLVHGWESLVELCGEIDNDPLLSKFVGLNLDIAHWILAGDISPEQVWDTPEVRNRIVHAHIAGHHRCSHLGDLHLYDLNKPEDFLPWIDLLRRIAAEWRDPQLPQFSGYVSLEYEAAKQREDVADCSMKLEKLLRGIW